MIGAATKAKKDGINTKNTYKVCKIPSSVLHDVASQWNFEERATREKRMLLYTPIKSASSIDTKCDFGFILYIIPH